MTHRRNGKRKAVLLARNQNAKKNKLFIYFSCMLDLNSRFEEVLRRKVASLWKFMTLLSNAISLLLFIFLHFSVRSSIVLLLSDIDVDWHGVLCTRRSIESARHYALSSVTTLQSAIRFTIRWCRFNWLYFLNRHTTSAYVVSLSMWWDTTHGLGMGSALNLYFHTD